MGTSNRYHHGDLRSALVREASAVLEASGAAAISFRGLARNLDVSHAAPGHHFASRTDLLAELATDGFAALADALEHAMDTPDPQRWPETTARAYLRFGLANPERYRLMFTSRLTAGDCPERLSAESSRAYRALLRAVCGQPPVGDAADYRLAAPELRAWSLVHGAVMLWLDGQLGDGLDEAAFLELIDEVVTTQYGR